MASGNAANASGEKGQLRFEVVERRESEPADFDAFGNLGAFGGADEVNAGLGQSLVVDDREDGSVVVGPFAEADAQGILAAGHAVAQEGGAMGREKGPVVAKGGFDHVAGGGDEAGAAVGALADEARTGTISLWMRTSGGASWAMQSDHDDRGNRLVRP